MALLWRNLIGVGVTGELPHYPMPGKLHSTPHERPKIQQRCPHLGIYRKKGGKLLNFFSSSFPLCCCFCISLAFFYSLLCVGLQIKFCRGLNGPP